MAQPLRTHVVHDSPDPALLRSVIEDYQQGKFSLGKAAELLGMNRLHFMDLLAERGVDVYGYDESDFDLDVATLGRLNAGT